MKVILGNLKEKGEELQSFLEPRVGVKPTLTGGELAMEDSAIRKGVKPRQVKTYVKRFLHQKGLRKSFRVLVSGSELTVQELEREEEKEEEAKKEPKVEKKEAPPEEEKKEAEEKKEKPKPRRPPRAKKKTGTKKS